MDDNNAQVQDLILNRIKLTKPDGNIKLEILYNITMLINEHESAFLNDLTIDLAIDSLANIQADVNNLWADVRETLIALLDLDME